MKIMFTGGGTGGHFYPIIAVAEAVNEIAREQHLIEPTLYYAADTPYDRDLLTTNNLHYVYTAAGKVRTYTSILNFFDLFKTGWGVVRSILRIFFIYPDVVFGKGGYASFPTLLAARIFGIPVVIHESDAVPGRVNRWAGKFAARVAVSYPQAADYFPKDRVAYTGNPVRKAALLPARDGALEFFGFTADLPVLFVTGGSQGAQAVNDCVIDALPELLEHYQVIHQTGAANFTEVTGRANLVLSKTLHTERYKPMAYLNDLEMRMAAGAAALVISRAGSTIFEIAAWGVPSILIPLPSAAEDHQTKNAYAYAHAGAGSVIEQNNLTEHILIAEIARLTNTPTGREMGEKARSFARADAARLVAQAIIDIALSHEA